MMTSIIRRMIIIVSFGIFLLSLNGCMTLIAYDLLTLSLFDKNVLQKIKDDSAVLDVKKFSPDLDDFPKVFQVQISFVDGGSMRIYNIDMHGKGTKKHPMKILYIDNYGKEFFNKNEMAFIKNKDMEIWSAIIGVQLKTVFDLVKNYPIMSKNIRNWNDLSVHKQEGDKRNHTIARIIENNLYSDFDVFKFNGQEIILFKYPNKILWGPYWGRESD